MARKKSTSTTSQTQEQTVKAASGLVDYDPGGFFCEMTGGPDMPAPHCDGLIQQLGSLEPAELVMRSADAERELFNLGITFTVYTDRTAIDRILPFDVIPRVISSEDWASLEAGVKQRVKAINHFLYDVYHDRKIIADGVIPEELVVKNKNYQPAMIGFDPPCGTYCHICGIDLVRGQDGVFRVLEDNARIPSGVSYVVENRHMMLRSFPELLEGVNLRTVSDYGQRLTAAITEVAPEAIADPTVVLLSPGAYNSAYFEHIFLAREMGVTLVEGNDLLVDDDRVYMKTTAGVAPVHAIYRRVDDAFLDPEVFRKDSLLGVPGLMRAYKAGNVTLCNAVGTGVADDKAVYAYMPRIIQYYLGEEAIIPNVETHICGEKEGLAYTLANMKDLVLKPVGESGGYGITVGPLATAKELEEAREKLVADPANWISQPMVRLSVSPTLIGDKLEPRHVDLRPFIVTGRDSWVLPGGLTRVALKRGSIVVNSSQGGGSKDTWVIEK